MVQGRSKMIKQNLSLCVPYKYSRVALVSSSLTETKKKKPKDQVFFELNVENYSTKFDYLIRRETVAKIIKSNCRRRVRRGSLNTSVDDGS